MGCVCGYQETLVSEHPDSSPFFFWAGLGWLAGYPLHITDFEGDWGGGLNKAK